MTIKESTAININSKRSYLEFCISHLEHRVDKLDTKAQIIIAIQTGIFGILALLFKELFLDTTIIAEFHVGMISLIILAITSGLIIFFTLMITRPTKHIFSEVLGIQHPHHEAILWHECRDTISYEGLKSKIDKADEEYVIEDYTSTLFVVRQLYDIKYKIYRDVILALKIETAGITIGLITLFSYKYSVGI